MDRERGRGNKINTGSEGRREGADGQRGGREGVWIKNSRSDMRGEKLV